MNKKKTSTPAIIIRPQWYLPDSAATSEREYRSRREFIRMLGLGAVGVGALGIGCARAEGGDGEKAMADTSSVHPTADLYPAPRNEQFTVERPLTDQETVYTYNNFYEFSERKEQVHQLVDKFETHPWEITVDGLVENPITTTVEDLVRTIGLEERLYRFRCVEAWAMTVPWTGFPLSRLIEQASPKSSATHVRFLSFNRPDQAPNQKRATWYEWPYYEGLRLDEAMNELTLAATGIYGEPLPKQNGAPLRIILPWKYGFKGPKSIVRIELVDRRPTTFWNDLAPREYDFYGNVDPEVPHPRWSQATERLIGSGDRVDTRKFNGYGEFVAGMYSA